MLVSTDVYELTEEKRSILMNKEVLDVHWDPMFVAGERVRKDENGGQLWTRPLANGDYAAVLYNSNNKTALTLGMSWSDVGWDNSASVLIHDLWLQKDVGVKANGFEMEIPINDVFFVRLTNQNAKK